MKHNSDEPAFPIHLQEGLTNNSYVDPGLTKRELFAMSAMNGLLSNPSWMKEYEKEKYIFDPPTVSKLSLEMADQLLRQLESK